MSHEYDINRAVRMLRAMSAEKVEEMQRQQGMAVLSRLRVAVEQEPHLFEVHSFKDRQLHLMAHIPQRPEFPLSGALEVLLEPVPRGVRMRVTFGGGSTEQSIDLGWAQETYAEDSVARIVQHLIEVSQRIRGTGRA